MQTACLKFLNNLGLKFVNNQVYFVNNMFMCFRNIVSVGVRDLTFEN